MTDTDIFLSAAAVNMTVEERKHWRSLQNYTWLKGVLQHQIPGIFRMTDRIVNFNRKFWLADCLIS